MTTDADTVRRLADSGRLATRRSGDGHRVVAGEGLARYLAEQEEPGDAGPIVGASARNRFTGIVTKVVANEVVATVELRAGRHRIVSLMTAEAVAELGLRPGVLAVAAGSRPGGVGGPRPGGRPMAYWSVATAFALPAAHEGEDTLTCCRRVADRWVHQRGPHSRRTPRHHVELSVGPLRPARSIVEGRRRTCSPRHPTAMSEWRRDATAGPRQTCRNIPRLVVPGANRGGPGLPTGQGRPARGLCAPDVPCGEVPPGSRRRRHADPTPRRQT